MSKIGYFHFVKNKIYKFRHFACIQNAVAYDCCDVGIILRQLKFEMLWRMIAVTTLRQLKFEMLWRMIAVTLR